MKSNPELKDMFEENARLEREKQAREEKDAVEHPLAICEMFDDAMPHIGEGVSSKEGNKEG